MTIKEIFERLRQNERRTILFDNTEQAKDAVKELLKASLEPILLGDNSDPIPKEEALNLIDLFDGINTTKINFEITDETHAFTLWLETYQLVESDAFIEILTLVEWNKI